MRREGGGSLGSWEGKKKTGKERAMGNASFIARERKAAAGKHASRGGSRGGHSGPGRRDLSLNAAIREGFGDNTLFLTSVPQGSLKVISPLIPTIG
jgi:hypothetical protein